MKNLIFSFIFLSFIQIPAQAQLRVCKDCPFRSITTALNAAKAGDIIQVEEGLYTEGNLIIDKPIQLIAKGKAILDGENKYEIITITSNNTTIKGFEFRNTGVSSLEEIAAIKVKNASGVVLENNSFQKAFFGIYLANSKKVSIRNNQLFTNELFEQHNGNGIHAWKCDSILIENNTITGHRDGIYFEFVTNSEIRGNLSKQNLRYGLHFMFSHQNRYKANTFRNNGAGVAVMYTDGIEMRDNVFESNIGGSAYGLLLKDIKASHIEGNIFRDNSTGIYMEGTSRSMFVRNRFSGNGWALRIQASCDDNEFRQNNFTGNSFDLATNGHTVLNLFENNYWDKYDGYDLDKDGIGDVPYRPLSLYSILVEKVPAAMMLYRSMLVQLMDKMERVIPSLTPENFIDLKPSMRSHAIDKTTL